ncbi:MAG TPA: patatin-like phospholipase family protein [Gemmatimonadales bacterium]|nr:patatin-like phospholipase family protein [Gemmatimonadales bacterium]
MANTSYSDVGVVLAGGGARAAYQVGVLQALAEQVPELEIPIITGVSAGAISAAFLAGHPGPIRRSVGELRGEWLRLTADKVYSVPARGVVRTAWHMASGVLRRGSARPTVRGLLDMRPLARFLARSVDFPGIEANVGAGRLRALGLSATSYDSGKTVTFVHSRPEVPLWERANRTSVRTLVSVDHVMASSAIPILFPAVRLNGGYFGDGSVRDTAPLAPAIHLGARRLIVIGMRASRGPGRGDATYPTSAAIAAMLLHSVFLDALDADVERLERINTLLGAMPAEVSPPGGLKPVELVVVRPSRDLGAMARGYRPRLPLPMDWMVRSMGSEQERGADFLSYLMFEPDYMGLVMEMGYEDGKNSREAVEKMLG